MLKSLSPRIKQALRLAGHRIGVDVRVNGPEHRNDLRLRHFLEAHGVDTVLDVGANVGQFGRELFDTGYAGRVVSFEPLPEAHTQLVAVARKSKQQWEVAPPVALSDEKGTAEFNVAHATSTSSLLKPSGSLVSATPGTRVNKMIKVPTDRLDALADAYRFAAGRVLLKLDVQGAEKRALVGAGDLLNHFTGILVEMSIAPLYEGQETFDDLHAMISGRGFELWDVCTGYRNPGTFQLKQMDFLYFRAS